MTNNDGGETPQTIMSWSDFIADIDPAEVQAYLREQEEEQQLYEEMMAELQILYRGFVFAEIQHRNALMRTALEYANYVLPHDYLEEEEKWQRRKLWLKQYAFDIFFYVVWGIAMYVLLFK